MLHKTQKVMDAWGHNNPFGKSGSALWTDGKVVYSYKTPIVIVHCDFVLVNMTKYTVTTTRHQNGILEWLPDNFDEWGEVYEVPVAAAPSYLATSAADKPERKTGSASLYQFNPELGW